MEDHATLPDHALFMLVADGEIRASGDPGNPIAWLEREQLDTARHDAHFVRLGTLHGHPRYAAVRIGQPRLAQAAPFRPARQAGYLGLFQLQGAAPIEQQFAARALHMSAWLHRSAHCGSCGHGCDFVTALNKRMCRNRACQAETYPRIEPAVIVLVTRGDECLLARQPGFPKRYFAPLAGFVEAGETPEQAVAREVLEETGQQVQDTRYIGAQPWPYPGSLMLGFTAAIAEPRAIILSDELEEACWFARAAVQQALTEPGSGPLFVPPPGVIGCMLLEQWLAGK